MATGNRPEGARRSPAELVGDSQRVAHVTEFFPKPLVRWAVDQYFKSDEFRKAAEELGDPDELAAKLSPIGALRQQVSRLTASWYTAPPPRLDEEIETAMSELATFWLDAVLLAWRRWGNAAGDVRLDHERLMPVRPADEKIQSQWARWDSAVKQARQRLESSVAMTSTEIDNVYREFSNQVRRQVVDRKIPLELPSGIALSTSAGAPILVSRAT